MTPSDIPRAGHYDVPGAGAAFFRGKSRLDYGSWRARRWGIGKAMQAYYEKVNKDGGIKDVTGKAQDQPDRQTTTTTTTRP
jgi:hypothetical protein